jgi:hypothetical protein
MHYKKVYTQIIESAKLKQYNQYTEKHHIIPKCLGGDNKKSNIVCLSYREHFICHWLLCKIYPENHKLKAAFAKMLGGKKRIVSSWMFETVKRNIKDTHFEWLRNKEPWNKGKSGTQIPWNKGLKTGPLTEEEKIKRSLIAKEYWSKREHHRKGKSSWCVGTKGIVKAWNKGKKAVKIQCPHCSKIIGGEGNYKRWHGDNCINKQAIVQIGYETF